MPRPTPRTYAPPIQLDTAALGADDDSPVWIQVAKAGAFRGHASGAFTFTAKVFDQIVRNFRAHPSFKAGPDGYGVEDVIAFDFHHASEKAAAELAVAGAPAQAWAQDLEVRTSESGQAQLWALTRYLPLARQYVRGGQYKWTSVAVWPDAVDPVTAEKIGWYLSSIAFTNDPFIQGMVPIAAETVRGAQALRLGGHHLDPYNPPQTIEDVVCSLREVLGIDRMADLPAIFGELAKLRAFAMSPETAPPGVEVAEMVGSLRILLNLPTLSDAATVFAELDKLLAAISTGPSAALATTRKDHPMSIVRTFLLGRLALTATATEEAVVDRLKIELDAGGDAKAKLAALLTAVGIENPDDAVNRIAQLMKSAADLELLMPELAALKEQAAKAEGAAAEADVEEVMATREFPASTRAALLHYRQHQPAKFAAEYPKLQAGDTVLASTLATSRAGAKALARTEEEPIGTAPPGSVSMKDIDAMPGANTVDKAMALARKIAKDNAEPPLTLEEAHMRGVHLARMARRSSTLRA